MAIGRRANTDALDLAAGGLDNERGRIIVNDKMATNVSGVYAIGDCVFGHAQLAHTASAMGEVAAENIPLSMTSAPTPPVSTLNRKPLPLV